MKLLSIFAIVFLASQSALAQTVSDSSDSRKWNMVVFTSDGCIPCAKLKTDFAESKYLSPWGQSTHLDFVNINLVSQSQRSAFEVSSGSKFPVIVLYPPKGSRYPYRIVFRQSGYDGDAYRLSHDIYRVASQFIKTVNNSPNVTPETVDPCPDRT